MPATCGGFDVLTAHVAIPTRGPWTAEVILDSPGTAPPTVVTLAEEGGISLAGVVARGGVNPALLRWEGVLVGGAGGLSRPVKGAFEQVQVGDVLREICGQSGEALSDGIDASLLAVELDAWTLGMCSASAALDALAGAAAVALGSPVTWRTQGDGAIWMGVETWPAAILPADAEIIDPSPLSPFTTIACQVASLMPGVDLAGVGRVTVAEYWIAADSVRLYAWTDPDAELAIRWRRLTRAALGLDPMRETPQVDRLARYRCRVVACASDGSTVDLQPDDDRLEARKNVKVIKGAPGFSSVVEPGGVCWIEWEGGDPSKPRAAPEWEEATVTKMIIAAALLYLGGESGAHPAAFGDNLDTLIGAALPPTGILGWLATHTHPVSGAVAGASTTTLPTKPALAASNALVK